jgi:GTP pyrophosphokinase
MHRIAEEGVAAHWAYKEQGRDGKGGQALSKKDAAEFGWLRQLVEFQREVDDPREFLETVKVDLFSDEVFVFTPKGDIKALPRGSTPVDFAYTVHTQVGQHCVGGKVNGKLVPLRHKLKNGDSVEILTSPHAHPSKDWLTFVKTSRAQARIRQYLRVEEHRRSMEIGRELAEKDLRKYGLSLSRVEKSGELAKAGEKLGHRTAEEVLAALGYGKLTSAQLLAQLLPQEQLTSPPPEVAPSRLTELFRKVARRSTTSGVRVSGVDDMLVRYGKCCNPVPGDQIVGFITRGRGVTVHTATCDKVLESSAERRVDVTWDVKGDFKRPVALRVVGTDRPGLLAKISKAFGEAEVNISQATVKTTGDKAVFDLEVTIGDLKQLNGIMRSIERIDGIQTVNRV